MIIFHSHVPPGLIRERSSCHWQWRFQHLKTVIICRVLLLHNLSRFKLIKRVYKGYFVNKNLIAQSLQVELCCPTDWMDVMLGWVAVSMLLYSKSPCVVNFDPIVIPGLYLFSCFPFFDKGGGWWIRGKVFRLLPHFLAYGGGTAAVPCLSCTLWGGVFLEWGTSGRDLVQRSEWKKEKLVVQEGEEKGRSTYGGWEGFWGQWIMCRSFHRGC